MSWRHFFGPPAASPGGRVKGSRCTSPSHREGRSLGDGEGEAALKLDLNAMVELDSAAPSPGLQPDSPRGRVKGSPYTSPSLREGRRLRRRGGRSVHRLGVALRLVLHFWSFARRQILSRFPLTSPGARLSRRESEACATIVMAVSISVTSALAQDEAEAQPTPPQMIVAVGAPGTVEYEEVFTGWAKQWQAVAESAEVEHQQVGLDQAVANDREALQKFIAEQKNVKTDTPLWVVLLGHGTSERKTHKFNLRGPDISSTDLKDWLADCQRPLIVIGGFSCSGAFLQDLTGDNRVVITATNSGAELNYSRFGGYLAESLNDIEADLDHDEQVSLLEAFLLASSKTARFYESESRLATEHSLLEDNRDGKGTSADFFVGIRAEGTAKDGSALDGQFAHRFILLHSKNAPKLTVEQLAKRDKLEAEIETLRAKKKTMPEDSYYEKLEKLMIELAKLYEAT